MARKATKRVRVQSTDTFNPVGVHAPSVVQTNDKAAQNWAALGNALKVGMQSAATLKGIQNKADLEAGAEAAVLGEVDETTLAAQEKSKAWVKGARTKLAEARSIADAADAQEYYQTQVDKNLPVEAVDELMTQWWKQRYDGMDPEMRSAVAPHMDLSHRKILSAHAQAQSAETAAEIEDAVLASTTQAFRDGAVQGREDWAMLREEAVALVGKDRANDLLMASVETHVAESNDAAVWDAPYLEKLASNPKYAARVAKSKDDATRQATKARQQATIVERAIIEADLIERAQAGDASILTDVRKQLDAGNVDEEIVRSVVKSYADAVVKGTQTRIGTEAFMDGTTSYHNLNNEDYDQITLAARGELIAQHGEEVGFQMWIDGIAKNGRMPNNLKRVLENASPSNPQSFDQAYRIFATLRSADPAGYGKLVTDETEALFSSYEVLVNDYGPEVAIQKMAEIDPSLVSKVDRGDYNDALNDAVERVEDGPFFNNLDEADPYTRKLVTKRMNHMIALGYSPEDAAEFAVNDLKSRYTIADGKLWPNTAGFQSDPTSVLEYTRERYSKLDPEGREIEVVPHMSRPGYAWVRPKGSLAFGGELVKVGDLDSHYRADQVRIRDEALEKAQAETKADMLNKAKQRATGLYSISHDKSVMGDRMRQAQDDAWYKLTPAERQKVLEEVEAEAAADRADWERRRSNPDIMLAP